MPAGDMLARLAVFYLAAIPEREGALIREPRASFEVEGCRWSLPDSLTDRDELLAIVTRHRQARRAAVGGNEALLGSRRADAVWLDITDRERPLVEVHEIKTSRADLVSELRQPEKSAAWMQRANRFWLTVPQPALVADLSIPEEWGVLALPFGSLPVVLREAPPLTPTVSFRRNAGAYVRRNAVARWRFDGEYPRVVSGRYTVASRLRPESGKELINRNSPAETSYPARP
jgi:hypothetical protein